MQDSDIQTNFKNPSINCLLIPALRYVKSDSTENTGTSEPLTYFVQAKIADDNSRIVLLSS